MCEAILQALGSLSVADNQLQQLPASMAGLVSLKQLWAYGNHLQSLPADILNLPAIRRTLTAICHNVTCFCRASFAVSALTSPFPAFCFDFML